MAWIIPGRLAANCRNTPERAAWLARLPDALRNVERRWGLTLSAPFDGDDVSCAWVAPAVLADGTPAIRKLAIPHMEGEHELQALRFWDGDPTVLVLYSDDEIGAMLLERCEPGTALRALPEPAAGCGDRRATASTLARAISAAHVSSSVHPD